jgi:hypothetical protein
MKRIALAVAVVVIAAGACKKAQTPPAASSMPADTMKMADSMKMMAPADTSKMHAAPPPAPAPAKPAAKPAAKPTRRP